MLREYLKQFGTVWVVLELVKSNRTRGRLKQHTLTDYFSIYLVIRALFSQTLDEENQIKKERWSLSLDRWKVQSRKSLEIIIEQMPGVLKFRIEIVADYKSLMIIHKRVRKFCAIRRFTV